MKKIEPRGRAGEGRPKFYYVDQSLDLSKFSSLGLRRRLPGSAMQVPPESMIKPGDT